MLRRVLPIHLESFAQRLQRDHAGVGDRSTFDRVRVCRIDFSPFPLLILSIKVNNRAYIIHIGGFPMVPLTVGGK